MNMHEHTGFTRTPQTMIDLFAGAGGLSEGLQKVGFRPLFASELVPVYAQTYAVNHPDTRICIGDIRRLDANELRTKMSLERGQIDLVAGGPPCQGFSINAPARSSEDERNHLFREYLRFVDAFAPRAVLIENVPGLVSFENGSTLHAILCALNDLGYGASVRILGAAYYGVPQSRWRTFIIGLKDREVPDSAYPKPICEAPLRKNFTSHFEGKSIVCMPDKSVSQTFVTVRDAIGDLPPLRNGERGLETKPYPGAPTNAYQKQIRIGSSGIRNHEAGQLSEINCRRLAYIAPGGNWTDIPFDLLPKGMRKARRSDHTKRYGRANPDDLACTILTKCDPHWGAFFHYEQDRVFTVREAARIQSFPDHFVFTGSQSDQYAQVGNAVPPLLAEAVGRSLLSTLERKELS